MRDIVGGTVAAEEEGGDRCFARIVSSGGPEFEKVEDGEGGYEEGDAPEDCVGYEAEVEGDGGGDCEDDADEEGSQCDARKRLGLPRKELLLELSDSIVDIV